MEEVVVERPDEGRTLFKQGCRRIGQVSSLDGGLLIRSILQAAPLHGGGIVLSLGLRGVGIMLLLWAIPRTLGGRTATFCFRGANEPHETSHRNPVVDVCEAERRKFYLYE